MSSDPARPAEDPAFDGWLASVLLDDRPEPTATAPEAGPMSIFPASYIRRAIIDHQRGIRTIFSGIEARRMRFTGNLHLQNLDIPFPLFFVGCVFEGAIHIGGGKTKTLGFTSCRLMLGADLRNARVDGHVFLRGAFEANGPLLLRDIRIEGSLDLNGGRFLYDGTAKVGPFWRTARGDCLGLSRADATAVLWSHAPPDDAAPHRPEVAHLPPKGKVVLRDMSVRSFRHDMATRGLAAWPAAGKLIVDGFTYDHIDEAPRETLLDWLALQERPSPAPYFTLASVLQKQGCKEDAVGIRAQVRRNEVAGYGAVRKFFARLVFWPVDYGASPVRALGLMILLLGLYWTSVAGLAASGRMAPAASGTLFNACYYGHPTCREDLGLWRAVPISEPAPATRHVPPDYPQLSPVQYSLEAFAPFLDFGQRDHWEPTSSWVRLILALVSLVGIFLGSLFFAAVTGLMRPRES